MEDWHQIVFSSKYRAMFQQIYVPWKQNIQQLCCLLAILCSTAVILHCYDAVYHVTVLLQPCTACYAAVIFSNLVVLQSQKQISLMRQT